MPDESPRRPRAKFAYCKICKRSLQKRKTRSIARHLYTLNLTLPQPLKAKHRRLHVHRTRRHRCTTRYDTRQDLVNSIQPAPSRRQHGHSPHATVRPQVVVPAYARILSSAREPIRRHRCRCPALLLPMRTFGHRVQIHR